MNNKDYWILTLNLLFERASFLIKQKDTQVNKMLNNNTEYMDVDELNVFTENIDSKIDEICGLIEYVYKYRHKKENPFENYIPTKED